MEGVVEVRGGRIQGVRRGGVWSFSGIPYAGPPTGRDRWRPPTPPAPWTGARMCDRFGPTAPQAPAFVEAALGGEPEVHDEECLFLNVWTPELDGRRRPVMVWVHGGSFVSGSGSSLLYRGGMLAREGDVVVVTFNYRLGLLGFLAHPALADDAGSEAADAPTAGFGNWGLADQIAALRWVQDHISDFGGDPGSVTLFGESAGGMGVATLLAVPAARGLVHRAIVESGPPYTLTAEEATTRAEKIAAHLGVPMTRAALEAVPATDLVRAVTEFGAAGAEDDPGLLVMPVIDGGLLPFAPLESVAAGSASDVPLLIGTTRDESSFFALGSPALSTLDSDGLRRWLRRLSDDDSEIDEMTAALLAARSGRSEAVAPRDLWVAAATEYVFRLPSIRFADAHAAAARPGAGTFCYLFTWETPAFGGVLGACHVIDVPFVFGSVHNPTVQLFSGGGEEAFAFSAAVRAAWTSFARSGVPEGDAGVWRNWDPAKRPTTVLGPWPGGDGFIHQVARPRDEELEATARLVAQGLHPPL